MNIFQTLKEKGYETIPSDFYDKISEWKSWYDGDVKNFHNFKIFNGQNTIQCHRYTMGMAKKVCEDWANLLMNEKVKITLEGTAEQEFFDSVCKNNNFEVRINEMQEFKVAFGTTAYIVSVENVAVNSEGVISGIDGSKISIDYVTAANIFPISWRNREVTECAFVSEHFINGQIYAYIQIHRLDSSKNYVIENSLYESKNENLNEVSLASVEQFKNVAPVIHTHSPHRMFTVDRLNISNNIDLSSPMGISVYANAIDPLKGVDIAYDSYINEFVLGKKKIMIQPGATRDIDGKPYFDPNAVEYFVLPEDIKDGNVVTPIDMSLRTEEHNKGMQDMLNVLSSKCGFGENHYRYENGGVSTATEIISENSSMFRTIKKHEIILESVLIELCRIVLRLGNSVFGLGLDENIEISIDFDDSIIEDKQVEFNRTMQLLNAGLIPAEEARSILMNEDIETARAALPKMTDMVTEEENEIE